MEDFLLNLISGDFRTTKLLEIHRNTLESITLRTTKYHIFKHRTRSKGERVAFTVITLI